MIKHISQARLADDLWHLVNIPSPTCQERTAALDFAEMLADTGAAVELDETIPESPNVIGRLQGNRAGKTFQLAGHIDHIDVGHAEPVRETDIISGRGSADMKNGLAAILEMVRMIKSLDGDFPGELLVTIYGRHEAPLGDSAGLLNLIRNGVKGDAALVTEGPEDSAWIMAKGAAVWQIELTREGDSSHELRSALNWEDFLGPGLDIAETLRQESARLRDQAHEYPLLGPESLFVGQMHAGDFYNRLANRCSFEGTRRWHPNKTFQQAEQEFNAAFDTLSCPDKLQFATRCDFVGESYEISPDEPVVRALQGGYRSVMDDELPIDGTALVTDACRLVNEGSVPTVLWGFGSFGAHADYEYVDLDRMHKACQICLAAVLEYMHSNE